MQMLVLSALQNGKSMLAVQLSDSPLNSRASSSGGQYIGTAAASSCTASGELSSYCSDAESSTAESASTADLADDVSDWSESPGAKKSDIHAAASPEPTVSC
jgi:hypothetical protein